MKVLLHLPSVQVDRAAAPIVPSLLTPSLMVAASGRVQNKCQCSDKSREADGRFQLAMLLGRGRLVGALIRTRPCVFNRPGRVSKKFEKVHMPYLRA